MWLVNQLKFDRQGSELVHSSTRVIRTFDEEKHAVEYLEKCWLSNALNQGSNKYELQKV